MHTVWHTVAKLASASEYWLTDLIAQVQEFCEPTPGILKSAMVKVLNTREISKCYKSLYSSPSPTKSQLVSIYQHTTGNLPIPQCY